LAGSFRKGVSVWTIDWVDGKVRLIEQTRLPGQEVWLDLENVEDLAEAISPLRVRGAPALGVAGILGVALAAKAKGIPIELRSESEVLELNGARLAPEGTRAYDPAFDVTPAEYVPAIVTEGGVVPPGELRSLVP
jgi:methylthioribose-1-phosphate isomerase